MVPPKSFSSVSGQVDTPFAFTFTSTFELPMLPPKVTAANTSKKGDSTDLTTKASLTVPSATTSSLASSPTNPSGPTHATKGFIINDSEFAPDTNIVLPQLHDKEWSLAWSSISTIIASDASVEPLPGDNAYNHNTQEGKRGCKNGGEQESKQEADKMSASEKKVFDTFVDLDQGEAQECDSSYEMDNSEHSDRAIATSSVTNIS
ncbi:hypothetical protein BG000_006909, partial [Podila horticola]